MGNTRYRFFFSSPGSPVAAAVWNHCSFKPWMHVCSRPLLVLYFFGQVRCAGAQGCTGPAGVCQCHWMSNSNKLNQRQNSQPGLLWTHLAPGTAMAAPCSGSRKGVRGHTGPRPRRPAVHRGPGTRVGPSPLCPRDPAVGGCGDGFQGQSLPSGLCFGGGLETLSDESLSSHSPLIL